MHGCRAAFFGSYPRKIIKLTLSKQLSFLGDFNSVSKFLDVLRIVSASASLNFSGFYPKTSLALSLPDPPSWVLA